MGPCVVLALVLISCASSENPAVQVIVTDKGLQYGKHVGAGWVQERLGNLTFPDISGEIPIHILGSVSYTLSGMTITKCDLPEPSVAFFQDAAGLKSSVSSLNVALKGDWSAHYGILHDGGSFNMAIFRVDLTSVVQLGKDADGRLSVASGDCTAHVGDVDLEISGGGSWVLQWLVKKLREQVKGQTEAKICPAVRDYVTNLEYHLHAMKVRFEVNDDLALDLPLTGSPVTDASSLNLGLKGEFYSIKTHQEPPFASKPFTLQGQPAYMLSVGLSEFTVNSASFGYFSAGLLQVLVNDSMIPPSCPLRLNTSLLGPFIPQLPKLFPGLLMSLQAYAREVPAFCFHSGAVKLNLQGAVKAFAIQPNATQTPLFKLNVDSDLSGKAWIADGTLKGSMAMDNFTLTLVSSEVGSFETAPLENLAKTVMKSVVMSKLNERLAKGVVLPRLKRAQLVNPVLKVEEGFISIASDAEWLPPGRTPT